MKYEKIHSRYGPVRPPRSFFGSGGRSAPEESGEGPYV